MSKRTRQAKPPSELASTIAEIHKEKGVHHIHPASMLVPFNHIPVGPFIMDYALCGGIQEGQSTMLYGYKGGGKTTLCNRIVAAVQKKYPDKTAAFVDMEGTYDPQWGATHGVDLDRLQMVRAETGEEAVDIIAALMDTIDISLIVIDGIPTLVPMKMDEKSAEDATVGKLAQLCGRLSSKISLSRIRERKRGHWVTTVFTNQWRSKVGVVLGDPRTLPGGYQIMHLNTMHIEIKNKEVLAKKEDEGFEVGTVVTNDHAFKITNGKGEVSIRLGEFQMVANPAHKLPVGTFLDAAIVATYARRFGLITGGGSSWKIEGVDDRFSKLADIEAFLYSNPDQFLWLKQNVIAKERVERGLPALPPDGYLLDWSAENNVQSAP